MREQQKHFLMRFTVIVTALVLATAGIITLIAPHGKIPGFMGVVFLCAAACLFLLAGKRS